MINGVNVQLKPIETRRKIDLKLFSGMLAVDKFVRLDYGSVFDSGLRATSPCKANDSMSGPGVN